MNDLENNTHDQLAWMDLAKKPRIKIQTAIGLLLLSLALIATSTYYYRFHHQDKTIPIIRADNTDFKIKPSYPGGMEVHNMDKTIYDNFSNKPMANKEEKILALPEEPVSRLKIIGEASSIEKLSVTKNYEKDNVKETLDKNQIIDIPTKKLPNTINKTKGYKLELASFKSTKQVNDAWEKIKKKHTRLVNQYKLQFNKKDIEYIKQLYKLQVGYLESETEARLVCKKFKNTGQDCLVIKP